LSSQVSKGYNLFMGKAGCGTCHFAPTFGGLAPPYFDDTEGEIIGVPSNKSADALDADLGRAQGKMRERTYIYAHAFKTPSLRNVELTAPYMHNGVFDSLEEVMDFYNKGGGQGIGLVVPNQTLPAKPLHLDKTEIAAIIMFMKSLTDTTGLTRIPKQLPAFSNPLLDNRKIGGVY
ncbi:MAG TPA: hypothetical protein VL947_10515, partial [Cytophagales bacterium]|nr:hypothetical protein [Cytophagales bacterium]